MLNFARQNPKMKPLKVAEPLITKSKSMKPKLGYYVIAYIVLAISISIIKLVIEDWYYNGHSRRWRDSNLRNHLEGMNSS